MKSIVEKINNKRDEILNSRSGLYKKIEKKLYNRIYESVYMPIPVGILRNKISKAIRKTIF